jgi:hypothetical protein
MELITPDVIVISNYWIVGFGAFFGLLAVAISGQ